MDTKQKVPETKGQKGSAPKPSQDLDLLLDLGDSKLVLTYTLMFLPGKFKVPAHKDLCFNIACIHTHSQTLT